MPMMTDRVRRRALLTLWVLTSTAILAGCGSGSNAENPGPTEQERRNAEVVREAFALGVGDEDSFYSILDEDVRWTVNRVARPTTYTSRAQFIEQGAEPITARLTTPIEATVTELITDGANVVALWEGTATARDGRPYVNRYAWSMVMRDEKVTQVVAYLDFVALDELLARVALPA